MALNLVELSETVKSTLPWISQLRAEIGRVVIGQRDLVDRLIVALLSNGHVLIEGVPGLAKTLVIKTLSSAIQATFSRIQFTPDLLPADILGTLVYNPKDGHFHTKKGPIFANLVLADEINRAPAKVQSALLESMQERQVTLGDQSYPLPNPFFVLATENPIDQEGTYPLPEAQLDRFMMKLKVGYPSKAEELKILNAMGSTQAHHEVSQVIGAEDLFKARKLLDTLYIDDRVKHYIIDIVFATRTPQDYDLSLDSLIQLGASPRATIALTLASKAWALLQGRGYVTPQDVKSIAYDVLRHRILLSYEAEAESLTSDHLIQKILNGIAVP